MAINTKKIEEVRADQLRAGDYIFPDQGGDGLGGIVRDVNVGPELVRVFLGGVTDTTKHIKGEKAVEYTDDFYAKFLFKTLRGFDA